jgi:hypothetical protein
LRREHRESRLRNPKSFAEDDDDDDMYSSNDERSKRKNKKPTSRVSSLVNAYTLHDVEMSRTGSSAMSRDPNRKCEVCGTSETPQWRRGPGGKRTLCNACGVKWSSGRLIFPTSSPGSPFPFVYTDTDHVESSEHMESSDPTGFEDIKVGTAAWKLQLEVSRLKSKLREVDRNQRRLRKLLSEGTLADRQIDRCYRKLIHSAKNANAKKYSPLKANEYENLFKKSEMDLSIIDDPQKTIRYGDSTPRDLQLEKSLISQFISLVQKTSE